MNYEFSIDFIVMETLHDSFSENTNFSC